MSNLTVEQELQLGALKVAHKPINDQLAILRQTRGQREVGSVKVPAHLASADVVTMAGPVADPRQCPGCGRGIDAHALSRGERVCTSCLANPTTDAGVEQRAGLAAVLPAR